MHHGLLFTGAHGLGKMQLAQCLARLVLCGNTLDSSACGECKSCQLLAANTHPDLFVLQPEAAGKAIKIDDVRALNTFLAQTSQQGGYKVAIIEPADAMNINAANALLKNLEEPAANTLLLLVSHAPSRLMATIRSRCQILPLTAPAKAEALAWLSPQCQSADPESLLMMSGGAPLAALALQDNGQLEVAEGFCRDLRKIAAGEVFSVTAVAGWLDTEPLFLVETLLSWIQAQLKQAATQAPAKIGPWECLELTSDKVKFRFYDKLLRSKAQLMSGSNPNKQLLLEELAMDWRAMTRYS